MGSQSLSAAEGPVTVIALDERWRLRGVQLDEGLVLFHEPLVFGFLFVLGEGFEGSDNSSQRLSSLLFGVLLLLPGFLNVVLIQPVAHR